ncbi:hypothetical protein AVEN_264113-1 [Araneus ventricosus]|uniref:Uncharacterized protein n=1 Tax=Araneus ventricosus TaxID=182803 RepID=A0A4Y2TJE3_ARAVE|nr:hypothetical protein AVEN_264113-1 [Araneus ventricosus]
MIKPILSYHRMNLTGDIKPALIENILCFLVVHDFPRRSPPPSNSDWSIRKAAGGSTYDLWELMKVLIFWIELLLEGGTGDQPCIMQAADLLHLHQARGLR